MPDSGDNIFFFIRNRKCYLEPRDKQFSQFRYLQHFSGNMLRPPGMVFL